MLAVFLAAGLELVSFEMWSQDRPGDREWQEWVISQLRNGLADGRVTQEHIDDVKNQVGAARCRPEEVAGASAAEAHPVSFDQAVALASEVLALLRPPSAS